MSPPQPVGDRTRIVDSDASTARALTLAAIVIQAIFFAVGIFVALFLLATTITTVVTSTGGAPGVVTTSTPFAFGVAGLVFGAVFLVSILWMALDYFLVYRNMGSPDSIPAARTPAIVLGIVQLIFGGLIPGILLIVAYLKIGDSMRRRGRGVMLAD
jgi:hypothetical protein